MNIKCLLFLPIFLFPLFTTYGETIFSEQFDILPSDFNYYYNDGATASDFETNTANGVLNILTDGSRQESEIELSYAGSINSVDYYASGGIVYFTVLAGNSADVTEGGTYTDDDGELEYTNVAEACLQFDNFNGDGEVILLNVNGNKRISYSNDNYVEVGYIDRVYLRLSYNFNTSIYGEYYSYDGINFILLNEQYAPNDNFSVAITAYSKLTEFRQGDINFDNFVIASDPNYLTFDTNLVSLGDLSLYLNETGMEYSLVNCSSTASGSITIPSVYDSKPVTSIGDSAFQDCIDITSVTIPDSVTLIEEDAFNSCSSLTNIIIGNAVTSIGEEAFEDCSSLSSVTIPDSVITIGKEAFEDCYNLTNVNIGNSVSSIGSLAFAGSGLTSIVIPGSVISIGANAFARCQDLTSVDLPHYFVTDLALIDIPEDLRSGIFFNSISEYLLNDQQFVASINQGSIGPQGPKGDTGDIGPQGPEGSKGDAGAQGPAGLDSSAVQTLRASEPHIEANGDGKFDVTFSVETSENLEDWSNEFNLNTTIDSNDSSKQFLRLTVE